MDLYVLHTGYTPPRSLHYKGKTPFERGSNKPMSLCGTIRAEDDNELRPATTEQITNLPMCGRCNYIASTKKDK